MSDQIFLPTAGPARALVAGDELASALNRRILVADDRRRRPRYFDGRFLAARDLTRDQTYFLTRQADLGRLTGGGVGHGLEVRVLQEGRSLRIEPGHGLTPAGELVVLREALEIDLADVPTMQRLSAAFGLSREPSPPLRNQSGLFVLALRPVEYTANPTAQYPASLGERRALEDGDIIEALAVSLVPYSGDPAAGDLDDRRARAAQDIFLRDGLHGGGPGLPADALPLAMVALERGLLSWIDPYLVRRDAATDDAPGFGVGRRSVREAFLRQYHRHLDDVLEARRLRGQGEAFAATEHFLVLPPAGRLPVSAVAVQGSDLTQAFFPPEMDVQISIVPEDELPALLEDSLDLPPIDLGLGGDALEAIAIAVLLPVPRAEVARLKDELTALTRQLAASAPSRLLRLKPLLALRSLKGLRPAPPVVDPVPLALNPWRQRLAAADALWYVRRRSLSAAAEVVPRAREPVGGEEPPAEDEPPENVRMAGEVALHRQIRGALKESWQKVLDELMAHRSLARPIATSGALWEIASLALEWIEVPLRRRPFVDLESRSEALTRAVEEVAKRFTERDLELGVERLAKASEELNAPFVRQALGLARVLPELATRVEDLSDEKLNDLATELAKIAQTDDVSVLRSFFYRDRG
ncbi:hypothetical protein [Sorangium sp. So ce513]|uniref:hypothetical protein n=1 Tax=Sorangium sp. So ce513 TaxID=3133315 RepID=UPI003F5EDBDE